MAELAPTNPEQETHSAPSGPGRSKDEVALDLMRFIAVTTGYGKASQSAGFSAKPAAGSSEAHADALLELYDKCRRAVHKSL